MQTKKSAENINKKSKTTHLAVKILAIFLLIAGIIMSLPLVPGPGLVTIIIALILLGEESKLGRWLISKFPQKVREEIKKRQRK